MSCAESARYLSVAEGNISVPVTFVLSANKSNEAAAAAVADEGKNAKVPMDEVDESCKHEDTDTGSDKAKEHVTKVLQKRPERLALGAVSAGAHRAANAPLCVTPSGAAQYPLIYVAPTGNMSVLLQADTVVEIAVDKALRVMCHGKFAASVNSRGSSSCIMHEHARIYQEDTRVFCQFGSKGEKKAVFGSSGVLFTMSGASDAYLVSASNGGTSRVPFTSASFPTLESDFSIPLFFLQSEMGEHLYGLCSELVASSHYDRLADGTVVINLHGVHIRHRVATSGEIDISCRPRHVRMLPTEGRVSVRSHYIDMGVVEADKFFVKRGVKRVHVSKSGIVASDGNCIASIDDHGQLVSNS